LLSTIGFVESIETQRITDYARPQHPITVIPEHPNLVHGLIGGF